MMATLNIPLVVRENLPNELAGLYTSRTELVAKLIEVSQQIAMLELYQEVDDQSKRTSQPTGSSREPSGD